MAKAETVSKHIKIPKKRAKLVQKMADEVPTSFNSMANELIEDGIHFRIIKNDKSKIGKRKYPKSPKPREGSVEEEFPW